MINNLRLAFARCAIIAAVSSIPLLAGAPPSPALERTQPAVVDSVDLVKKPWTFSSQAEGDLNNDGKPDVAIVALLEKDGIPTQSRLIVALRGNDGRLRIAAIGETATQAACGPSGGPATVDIKKNVLIVEQYCGSRERYNFTYKYQLRQNKWLLIGYTGDTYDSTAPDYSQNVDVNLVTGEVAASMSALRQNKSERFLEIRAAKITSDEPSVTDWSVPRIVIRPKTKEKPAIAVQGVFNKKKLFLKVQCDPATQVLDPSKVELVSAAGKVVAPLKRESSAYNYVLLTYDLNSPAMKASANPVQDWSSLTPAKFLRLSLTVKDGDSNATTARKSTGALLLSDSKEPLTLENIDVVEGQLVHPFIFKSPEESASVHARVL